jgi:hypothetical protein
MDALQQRCDELDRDKQHMHEVHQTNLDKLAAQVHYIATASIHNTTLYTTTLYSTSTAVCGRKVDCILVCNLLRYHCWCSTHSSTRCNTPRRQLHPVSELVLLGIQD